MTVRLDPCFQPFAEGDTVAFILPYYSTMQLGTIVKITPKGATISYGNDQRANRADGTFIKVTEQIAHAKANHPEYFI